MRSRSLALALVATLVWAGTAWAQAPLNAVRVKGAGPITDAAAEYTVGHGASRSAMEKILIGLGFGRSTSASLTM